MLTRPFILFPLAVVIRGGCSKHVTPRVAASQPEVVLASNEHGRAQLDYSGPDALTYRYSLSTFSFSIGPPDGQSWVTANGTMELDQQGRIHIKLHSSSSRSYTIQLLGMSAKKEDANSKTELKEKVDVALGEVDLDIQRYLLFDYDFNK